MTTTERPVSDALAAALTAANDEASARKARLAEHRQLAERGVYGAAVREVARAAADATPASATEAEMADAVVHALVKAGCLDVNRPPTPDDAMNELVAGRTRRAAATATRMNGPNGHSGWSSTPRCLLLAVGALGSMASLETLAKVAGVTPRTASSLLAHLVETGWLVRYEQGGWGFPT